jgi:hypothetical protein
MSFLSNIIAGQTDPLSIDFDTLIEIAERAESANDTELSSLLTQAMDIVSDALDKATQ